MPDQPPSRILFGPKELLQIIAFVALAGGAWVTLNVSAETSRENAQQLNIHETRITVIEEHVKGMKEDVGEIKDEQKEFNEEQQEQRSLLTEILFLVKKNNNSP